MESARWLQSRLRAVVESLHNDGPVVVNVNGVAWCAEGGVAVVVAAFRITSASVVDGMM